MTAAPRTAQRRIAGRYRLRDVLGRGGMGTVWLADDELLHRPVAIKEVQYPAGLPEPELDALRDRMLREARVAARLAHPGVVRMYDVVEEDGRPCLVMELLGGRTLAQVLREDGPLPPAQVARIGLQLLDGLQAAHAQGVIHRDVKPSNVMLEPHGAVLTDFGIAVSAEDPTLTSTGLLVGSPAFMAPERARQGRPGPASDLWSLGATLYTAVEGHPPYPGREPLATLTAAATSAPEPPVRAGPLAAVLLGLLVQEPDHRPDAAELRRQLDRVAAAPATTPPVPAGGAGRPAAAPRPPAERTLTLALGNGAETAQPQAGPDRAAVPAAGPGPAGRPPRQGPAGRRPGRWQVLALAGLLLFAAAAALAAASRSTGRRPHPSRPAAQAGTPASTPPPSSTPAASPAAPPAAAGAVPAGWVSYRSPRGWTVAHPAGWSTSTTGGETDFTAPAGGGHLRVDSTDTPGPSAVGAWQQQESGFAAQHAGYQRVFLGAVPYRDYQSADWTFQWDEGGTRMQANDRGMVTGGHGYALFFAAPAGSWAADQQLLAGFYSSFQP